MSMQNIIHDAGPVPRKRGGDDGGKRWDWDRVPVGASFDFDDAKPQAVLSSFAAHLMRGKYRVRHLGGGRYRFWRLG